MPQLKSMASQVLAEVGASGAAVQDDIVGEMCRWAHNGKGIAVTAAFTVWCGRK